MSEAACINRVFKPRDDTAPAHERVFRSSENMLYLAGGSNGSASLYTDGGFHGAVDLAGWKTTLAQRKAAIDDTGSKFAQLIVPEKLTIYPLGEADRHLLFPGLEESDIVAPGRRLLRELDMCGIVYPEDFMRLQREVVPVYPATDSHWTWQGAFSAFQVLMWDLGYRADYRKYVDLQKSELRYQGDLWEPKFADIEVRPFVRIKLPASIKRIYANRVIGLKEEMGLDDEQGLHTGSHCIFHNAEADFLETVTIFGSSFSECRLEPSLLTSMFAFYFSTVHFIWSTSVDFEYVKRHKTNITIAEIPERFLTAHPSDNARVEEASVDKIRAWREHRLQ